MVKTAKIWQFWVVNSKNSLTKVSKIWLSQVNLEREESDINKNLRMNNHDTKNRKQKKTKSGKEKPKKTEKKKDKTKQMRVFSIL